MASEPVLNVRETSRALRLSERSTWAEIASGALPHRRIGPGRGRVVTTQEDRDEYLEAHRDGRAA